MYPLQFQKYNAGKIPQNFTLQNIEKQPVRRVMISTTGF